MPRKRTGQVIPRGNGFAVRVTLAGDKRPVFDVPTCKTHEDATARAEVMSDLAARLMKGGHEAIAESVLNRAARASGDDELSAARTLVEQIESGAFKQSKRLRNDLLGNAIELRGRWYARTPIAPNKRRASMMPWAPPGKNGEPAARERAALLARLARALRNTGEPSHLFVLPKILDRAAEATDEKQLQAIERTVERLVSGIVEVVSIPDEVASVRPGPPRLKTSTDQTAATQLRALVDRLGSLESLHQLIVAEYSEEIGGWE
jgi:hypothetical protein